MQVPQTSQWLLPGEKNEGLDPPRKAMLSYPIRKPEQLLKPEDESLRLLKELQQEAEENEEYLIRKQYGITEEDDLYKIEKKAKSLQDYINYAKRHPDEIIAVLNPLTGEPQFVIKNKGNITKLYRGDGMLPYFTKYTENQRIETFKFQRPKSGLYGSFKQDKVDEIRLQKNMVIFNIEDLPNDVIVVEN